MTNTATTERHRLDWETTLDERDANYNRRNHNHVDECFTCGRGLTESGVSNGWYIHLCTDGSLFNTQDPATFGHPESQGCFPVGSECAKRIPRRFRFKMGTAS